MGASRDAVCISRAESTVNLTVAEVHSRAVNCTDRRNRRWTLLSDQREFQPRSILIGEMPEVPVGGVLYFNLARAPILYDPRACPGTLNARWRGLINEWAGFLDDLELSALRESIIESSKLGIASLSGMGPGLTPAGDDFAAGWVTAARCFFPKKSKEAVHVFCREWNPGRTTWLSRWMIKDAVRGYVWRRGKLLLSALEKDDPGRLLMSVNDILSWGHTSGMAWLAGLSAGVVDFED
jgi:hypothetical protein